MEFHPQAQMLLSFIAILTGVSAIGWTLMTWPLKIAPKASWHFAAANYLVLLGLYFTLGRTPAASYLHWFVADQLLLLGFVFMHQGMLRLFKIDHFKWLSPIMWLGFALAMLTQSPSEQDQFTLGIIFSLSALTSFILLSDAIYIGIKRDFGFWPGFFMALPTLATGLLFLSRIALIVNAPLQNQAFISINTEQAIPMLWAYTLLTLLANIMMFASAIARLTSKVRVLAERDQLTGLFNRHAIHRYLARIEQQWLAQGQPYSIILLDIDHFKTINDQHSHQAGDAALQHASKILRDTLPNDCVVSRYGGEEFLVVLPNCGSERCAQLAHNVQQTLPLQPMQWQALELALTASFGCATVDKGMSIDRLILLADAAMYKVKSGGRNGVAIASRDLF